MMGEYSAQVTWERGDARFTDNRYSRAHRWRFDGGLEVPGSSSPLSVPLPWSDPAAIDPEEVFVASLSSCHMLWFLSIAAKRKYCVDRYIDDAVGVMGKNEDGKLAMTIVTLRPEVSFVGEFVPIRKELEQMHQEA